MHVTRRRFLKAAMAFAALAAAGCTRNFIPEHPKPATYIDPPRPGDDLRLLVLGDWGSGQIEQWEVAQGMERVAAEIGGYHAGLMLGDNFYPGGVSSVEDCLWRDYFEQVYDTRYLGRLDWHPILGNHDYGGKPQAQIEYSKINPRWKMPAEYWSKTFRAPSGKPLLKVIGVDTNKEFGRWTEQMTWLDAELASAAAESAPAIVFGHHPIFNCGSLGAAPRVRKQLREKLVAAGVRAYLAGHEHNAQLIVRDGLTQLIQGGGGKTLTPLTWRDTTPGVLFAAHCYGFSLLRADASGIHFDWRDRDGNVLHTRAL